MKSLAISQLILNFSFLVVPDHIVKRIQRAIFNFIWKNKDRIKRNVLIGDKNNGGINIVDVDSKIASLKSAWVSRIAANSGERWTGIFRKQLRDIGFDINHILLMDFKGEKDFPVITNISTFYRECIKCYNSTKSITKNIGEHEFFQQIIWGNSLFMKKGKCLYFEAWVKAKIFFIHDLFNHHGQFHNEIYFLHKLYSTSNWMIEYLSMKKSIISISNKFCMKNCKFVNKNKVFTNLRFLHNNSFYDISTLNSKFFYNILCLKKSERSYCEQHWQNLFDTEILHSDWTKIYNAKVWQIPIQKISEFNYKLLHMLISCRQTVSKWKKEITPNCLYCNGIETVEHMIFLCPKSNIIWKHVGNICKIDIQWKHIVIGYLFFNQSTSFRNILFSFIAFCIYKSKILADFGNNISKVNTNINIKVKNEFINLIYPFQYMKNSIYFTYHKRLLDIIQVPSVT